MDKVILQIAEQQGDSGAEAHATGPFDDQIAELVDPRDEAGVDQGRRVALFEHSRPFNDRPAWQIEPRPDCGYEPFVSEPDRSGSPPRGFEDKTWRGLESRQIEMRTPTDRGGAQR